MKFSNEQIGEIRALLDLNWSLSAIKKHFKSKNVTISKSHLSRIKNDTHWVKIYDRKQRKSSWNSSITTRKKQRLEKMIIDPNPMTQMAMANKIKTSRYAVNRYIKRTDRKLVKKPVVHQLNDNTIQKRKERSWQLYNKLKCGQWRNIITSDESWFYMNISGGKTEVQYIHKTETRNVCETFSKNRNPKGVMVWVGISDRGVTKPRFVEPGAKINSNYYIKNILEPFIKEDYYRLYPEGNAIFHQDSAPSHASKLTRNFLIQKKIPFITPEEWLPNSPDVAPCDYFLWGHLKQRLKTKVFSSLKELKSAVAREIKKVPQDLISRALEAWPKRVRKVYYNKGLNIENIE